MRLFGFGLLCSGRRLGLRGWYRGGRRRRGGGAHRIRRSFRWWSVGRPCAGFNGRQFRLFFFGLRKQSKLHQGQFDKQPLVVASLVLHIGLVDRIQCTNQESQINTRGLGAELRFDIVRHFHQSHRAGIFAHEQVAQVRSEPRNEVVRIEAARNDAIEDEQRFGDFRFSDGVDHIEVGFLVEDVQVFCNGRVVEFLAGEGDQLIENTQRIAERAICLSGHYMQRSFFGFYPLFRADALQVFHHVRHGDAVEVEDLASRQNGRKDLVLFGCGEDEDRMRRWFFERLQKRIEGRL